VGHFPENTRVWIRFFFGVHHFFYFSSDSCFCTQTRQYGRVHETSMAGNGRSPESNRVAGFCCYSPSIEVNGRRRKIAVGTKINFNRIEETPGGGVWCRSHCPYQADQSQSESEKNGFRLYEEERGCVMGICLYGSRKMEVGNTNVKCKVGNGLHGRRAKGARSTETRDQRAAGR